MRLGARIPSTVWMKDPLVQVYYEKLLKEIEAARKMRRGLSG